MSKARILVADDDLALREMMRLSLEKEGYEVSAAADAASLARLAAERTFDLVVSDIYLGDGTAIDLLSTLAETNPRAEVILVTAQGTVETVAAAEEAAALHRDDQLVGVELAPIHRDGYLPRGSDHLVAGTV